VLFFTLQLAAALAFAADLPLVSALRGAADAGNYAIVQRLYSIVPLSLSLIWTALWPIYRHALAAKDHAWIKRTLSRSLFAAVAFALVVGIVLTTGFERIVGFWVHEPLQVQTLMLWGFATWCAVDAVGTALATFFNAASIMRYQVIVASIFAIGCFACKYWVIAQVGVVLLPWTTVVTYTVLSLLPTALFARRLIAAALLRDY
jgi:hypothetical protein